MKRMGVFAGPNGSGKTTLVSQFIKDKLINPKILSISYTDWKKMGFSKGTLHYMKENARDDKSFTLNAHVREGVRTFSKI